MRLQAARPLLRALTAAAAAGLLLVAFAYGYFRIFAQVAPYDDEGYVMQSVRTFLEGHGLYDEVFTQYGPAFYLLQALVHGLLRVPLTHDVVRLTTLLLWVATAAVSAGIVWRLTRSPAAAAITFVPVFIHLLPLINEPGHPQTLLGLTVALACLIVAADRGAITARHAACCGALAAFTALAKINVGTFLFLGLALPFVLASPLGRVAGPFLILFATAVPLVLLRQHLGDRSAVYGVIGAMSAASATLACWRLLRPATVPWKTLGAFVAACAATGLAIVLAILALGTSPGGLVQGVLVQPARLSDLFYMPVAMPRTAGLVAIGALPLAALLTWRRSLDSPAWPAIVFVCKASFALGTLYALHAGYVELMAFATPFVWIVLLPAGDSGGPRAQVARGVLACVAVFEFLQAYPVGGTQVAFATVPLIPMALVCLHDAMTLAAASARAFRPAMIALQAVALVWAMHAFTPLIGKDVLYHYYAVYMGSEELRLPGATRVRLPPNEVARLQWLAATVRANCSSFVALPGFQSLHPWTGIAPLTTKNAGTWMTLLDAEEQAELWRAVDARQTPCAILQRTVAANWIGAPVESLPAYAELMARFKPVADVDGYELLLRRDTAPAPPLTMALAAGRQGFARNRPPQRVVSLFINVEPDASIRAWIRTKANGVILGCQSIERQGDTRSAQAALLLYVGRSGRLYGQYDSASAHARPTQNAVNDGRWHHVVIVRQGSAQWLYVDGVLDHTTRQVTVASLPYCQAGTGLATAWPEAVAGWMPYTGEMEGLAVQARAWSADDVARDRAASQPRE